MDSVDKLAKAFGVVVLIMLLANLQTESALAVPFDIDCGGQADIDTDPATLVVCTAVLAGAINDLTVVLEIDDPAGTPYVSDLEIILTDDSTGTSAVLYTGGEVWLPDSYMDATFDDTAGAPAPTSGDVVGTFLPVDALAAFVGVELSGDWTLSLHDDFLPGEGLDLISWRLVGDYLPEPSTALLVSVGLLGIAVAGRRRSLY